MKKIVWHLGDLGESCWVGLVFTDEGRARGALALLGKGIVCPWIA